MLLRIARFRQLVEGILNGQVDTLPLPTDRCGNAAGDYGAPFDRARVARRPYRVTVSSISALS